MKALRYLLSMIAVVSVLGVSAHTPTYGTTYKGQGTQSGYTIAQMPATTMGSVNTGYVESGTTLPLAVQTGVVTTYDSPAYAPSRPKKELGDDDDDTTKPGQPFPIGNGLLPMMFMAAAMAGVIALRRRKKEEKAVSQTAQ